MSEGLVVIFRQSRAMGEIHESGDDRDTGSVAVKSCEYGARFSLLLSLL